MIINNFINKKYMLRCVEVAQRVVHPWVVHFRFIMKTKTGLDWLAWHKWNLKHKYYFKAEAIKKHFIDHFFQKLYTKLKYENERQVAIDLKL